MHTTWSTVIPVVTLVLGWGLASLSEFWKGNRDSAAQALERREARVIRRNEFQRENLLEAQQVAQTLMNFTGKLYEFRMSNSVCRVVTVNIPPEVGQELIEQTSKALLIRVRIRDQEVAKHLLEIVGHCQRVKELKDRDEIMTENTNLVKSFVNLNAQIGKVLAELDALDDQMVG